MMKRLFWLGAGVAVGVLVARKLNSLAEAYSPAGVAGAARESARGAVSAVKGFIADVREEMARREAQIREGLEGRIVVEDDFDLDEELLAEFESSAGAEAGPAGEPQGHPAAGEPDRAAGPVEAETRPSEPETRVTEDAEDDLSGGEAKPSGGEAKPSGGEAKPSGGEEPRASEDQPRGDETPAEEPSEDRTRASGEDEAVER